MLTAGGGEEHNAKNVYILYRLTLIETTWGEYYQYFTNVRTED